MYVSLWDANWNADPMVAHRYYIGKILGHFNMVLPHSEAQLLIYLCMSLCFLVAADIFSVEVFWICSTAYHSNDPPLALLLHPLSFLLFFLLLVGEEASSLMVLATKNATKGDILIMAQLLHCILTVTKATVHCNTECIRKKIGV